MLKDMCTLSFLPTCEGLRIGMNRDEQKSRATALPPRKLELDNKFKCLGPTEPGGGMWIAAGQNGHVFALLNWYSVQSKTHSTLTSRGQIIPSLIHCTSIPQLEEGFKTCLKKSFQPFRLITFMSTKQRCIEWRYDGITLERLDHPWKNQLWASSGFCETEAQKIRTETWNQWIKFNQSGQNKELLDFHRSHHPQKGANSICMHREDAETVSYTEIELNKNQCTLHYHEGPPCANNDRSTETMQILR